MGGVVSAVKNIASPVTSLVKSPLALASGIGGAATGLTALAPAAGQIAGRLVKSPTAMLGGALGGGAGMLTGALLDNRGRGDRRAPVAPVSPYSQAPIQQQQMAQGYVNPWRDAFIQSQRTGNPMPPQWQYQLPNQMNVMPLAWQQMQAPQQFNYGLNMPNMPQYQPLNQQIQPQIPYQYTGMFGSYNPFMPKQ